MNDLRDQIWTGQQNGGGAEGPLTPHEKSLQTSQNQWRNADVVLAKTKSTILGENPYEDVSDRTQAVRIR